MFSSRVPADLTPNRLTALLAERRLAGRPIVDLTLSNPTRAGLEYPRDLLAPLAEARGLVYRPQALGLAEAREAVAADYARRGVAVSIDRIALTASTSEGYSLVFKTLCEPGDEILVPRPSYPLLEHLAQLDALKPVPYDLEYHGVWTIGVDSIERALTARTRILLAVSPNNPTGSYVKADELRAMAALCLRYDLALVVDEVFADYQLSEPAGAIGDVLGETEGLTFSLSGLSKTIGLPQVKLGWIAAAGDAALVAAAMRRIEFVNDTYLSVATPVQMAAAQLLERGRIVRQAIQARVSANYRRFVAAVAGVPACQVLAAEGGWYGVMQVPTLTSEEDLVVALLTVDGVLVHPGYFFDFPRESFLVVSLLPPEREFAAGLQSILRHFDCTPRTP